MKSDQEIYSEAGRIWNIFSPTFGMKSLDDESAETESPLLTTQTNKTELNLFRFKLQLKLDILFDLNFNNSKLIET